MMTTKLTVRNKKPICWREAITRKARRVERDSRLVATDYGRHLTVNCGYGRHLIFASLEALKKHFTVTESK